MVRPLAPYSPKGCGARHHRAPWVKNMGRARHHRAPCVKNTGRARHHGSTMARRKMYDRWAGATIAVWQPPWLRSSKMEARGIDPLTSRMRSERSTI